MSNKVKQSSSNKSKSKSNKSKSNKMDAETSNINKNLLTATNHPSRKSQIGSVVVSVLNAVHEVFDIELDVLYKSLMNCEYQDYLKIVSKAKKYDNNRTKREAKKFVPYKIDSNGNFELKGGKKVPLKLFENAKGEFNLRMYWLKVYKDYITEEDKVNEKYFRNGKFHSGEFQNKKFKKLSSNTNSKAYKKLLKEALNENNKIKKEIEFQEQLIGVVKRNVKTSAWIVFVKESHTKYMKDEKFKSLKITERMKYISNKWSKMSDDKKAKYEKLKDEFNAKLGQNNSDEYDKFVMRIIEYNNAVSINNLSFYKANSNSKTSKSSIDNQNEVDNSSDDDNHSEDDANDDNEDDDNEDDDNEDNDNADEDDNEDDNEDEMKMIMKMKMKMKMMIMIMEMKIIKNFKTLLIS